MYSLEANIDKGWTLLADSTFNGVNIVRGKSDGIRVRDEVIGDVTIYGDSYLLLLPLKPQYRVGVRIKLDSDILIETYMRLDGEWNYKSNFCVLSFEQDDEYTQVLNEIDTDHIYNQGIPQQEVSMPVNISNRRLFQLRNVDGGFVPTTPAENELYVSCGDLSINAINYWDVNANYYRTPEIVIGNSNSDGWMCPVADVGQHFCWNNMNVLVRGYWAAKTDSKGKPPPILPISSTEWQYLGETQHTIIGWHPYEMGQNYATIKFTESVYDEQFERWALGACSSSNFTLDFYGYVLFYYLQDLLQKADNTISVDFNTFIPYVNATQPELKNLLNYVEFVGEDDLALNLEQTWSLTKVIDIYKTLFNVDWRLEDGAFVFRHPSEIPVLPTDYQTSPYQYVDINLSNDWSNEKFITNVDVAIKKEKFTIGTSENPYFGAQLIEYDNANSESVEVINFDFETDITNVLNKPYTNDRIVIIQYNNDLIVPTGYFALSGTLYNTRLMLFYLVQQYYNYGRPFTLGTLISVFNTALNRNLELIRRAVEETEISIPYNDQRVLDFDLLLVSTYGNLIINEFSVNLAQANSLIKAAK